jgi:ParB-like chromosome segregation protein Spo0J
MATATTKNFALTDLTIEGAGFANPRVVIDATVVRELADNIHKQGLMYPLSVWQTTDEEGNKLNVVVDGGTRLRAIERLQSEKRAKGLDKAIPCRIIKANKLADAKILALSGNIHRKDLSSFELAREMASMLMKKSEGGLGLDQKRLAKMLGKSEAWVSRNLSAYRKASTFVLKAWRQGKLPADDVQHITKEKDHAKQNEILEEVLKHREKPNGANGKASVKDRGAASKAAKKAAAKGKTSTTPKTARMDTEIVERHIAQCDKAKKSARYIKGLADGLRLAIGKIGAGELDKEWLEFAKQFYGSDAPKPPDTDTKKEVTAIEKAAKKGNGKAKGKK